MIDKFLVVRREKEKGCGRQKHNQDCIAVSNNNHIVREVEKYTKMNWYF